MRPLSGKNQISRNTRCLISKHNSYNYCCTLSLPTFRYTGSVGYHTKTGNDYMVQQWNNNYAIDGEKNPYKMRLLESFDTFDYDNNHKLYLW